MVMFAAICSRRGRLQLLLQQAWRIGMGLANRISGGKPMNYPRPQ